MNINNLVKIGTSLAVLSLCVPSIAFGMPYEDEHSLHSMNRKKEEDLTNDTVKKALEDHLKQHPAVLDSSKNKDIVVFLGMTGAGKSTLINYLSGKKLISSEDSQDITLVDSKDSSAMAIGTGKSSQTHLPQFIEHNIKDSNLIFYDLPGFGDNRGAAKSLLNACFIKTIIENAKTTRFVFVTGFDELTAARGEILTKLFKIMKDLIPLEPIDDLGSLIITKVDSTLDKGGAIQRLKTKMKGEDDVLDIIEGWEDDEKIAKMSKPNNKQINESDRKDIFEVIKNVKSEKIKNVNISAIYNETEQKKLIGVYKGEIEFVFDQLIKNTIDIDNIFSLDKETLVKKEEYFKNIFFDEGIEKLEKTPFISLIRPISEDSYKEARSVADILNKLKRDKILASISGYKQLKIAEDQRKEDAEKAEKQRQDDLKKTKAQLKEVEERAEEKRQELIKKTETRIIEEAEKAEKKRQKDLQEEKRKAEEQRRRDKEEAEEQRRRDREEADARIEEAEENAEIQRKELIKKTEEQLAVADENLKKQILAVRQEAEEKRQKDLTSSKEQIRVALQKAEDKRQKDLERSERMAQEALRIAEEKAARQRLKDKEDADSRLKQQRKELEEQRLFDKQDAKDQINKILKAFEEQRLFDKQKAEKQRLRDKEAADARIAEAEERAERDKRKAIRVNKQEVEDQRIRDRQEIEKLQKQSLFDKQEAENQRLRDKQKQEAENQILRDKQHSYPCPSHSYLCPSQNWGTGIGKPPPGFGRHLDSNGIFHG